MREERREIFAFKRSGRVVEYARSVALLAHWLQIGGKTRFKKGANACIVGFLVNTEIPGDLKQFACLLSPSPVLADLHLETIVFQHLDDSTLAVSLAAVH